MTDVAARSASRWGRWGLAAYGLHMVMMGLHMTSVLLIDTSTSSQVWCVALSA